MKRILIMAFVALLWYGSMSYVLLEFNPFVWPENIRKQFLVILFLISIMVMTYPGFKNETK